MNVIQKFRKLLSKLSNIERYIDHRIQINEIVERSLNSVSKGLSNETEIVVSLTTYSKRIYDVHLTIESLFRQTMQAKRIILWLSKDEFTIDTIPHILKKQQERGLEVRFCDDYKSYKKLIPTLSIITDSPIITVDDDYIYPYDFIERLVNTNRRFPDSVCYYTGSQITMNRKGVNPYLKWRNCKQEHIPSLLNFATGAGGVLYPAGCFSKEILNADAFTTIAPKADDLWFKTMTLLTKTKYVKVKMEVCFEDKFILLKNSQDIALHHTNVSGNENDKQLSNIIERYPFMKILLEKSNQSQ